MRGENKRCFTSTITVIIFFCDKFTIYLNAVLTVAYDVRDRHSPLTSAYGSVVQIGRILKGLPLIIPWAMNEVTRKLSGFILALFDCAFQCLMEGAIYGDLPSLILAYKIEKGRLAFTLYVVGSKSR